MISDILHRWKSERRIRKVLRGLARQRVALVLQPGNVWVIEQAMSRDQDVEADFQTCLMRGWVEILHDTIPAGELPDDMRFVREQPFTKRESIYRLTDGGWAALNRAHGWALINILIASASLFIALLLAAG